MLGRLGLGSKARNGDFFAVFIHDELPAIEADPRITVKVAVFDRSRGKVHDGISAKA